MSKITRMSYGNKKGKVESMYFDEGCVVVNYDIVIAAVINKNFEIIKSLAGYKENKNDYLKAICLCTRAITEYANRMKTWDLGRVVINFDANDALHYLQCHPELFKPFDSNEYEPDERKFFGFRIPENIDLEEYFSNLIDELKSHLNYSKRVLRSVGLYYDSDEEILAERNRLAAEKANKENSQSEDSFKMLQKVKRES